MPAASHLPSVQRATDRKSRFFQIPLMKPRKSRAHTRSRQEETQACPFACSGPAGCERRVIPAWWRDPRGPLAQSDPARAVPESLCCQVKQASSKAKYKARAFLAQKDLSLAADSEASLSVRASNRVEKVTAKFFLPEAACFSFPPW